MERHASACLLALLWLLLPMAPQAQNPAILHFGGSALPPGTAPDTAFCKGQPLVAVHGTAFATAPPSGVWLSTTASIGGIPCPLISVSDTLLAVALPDSFPRDTCLLLRVERLIVLAPDTFLHTAADTVCLTGDRAEVSYPATVFCLGDPNPLPSVMLHPPTATGGFCCRTGTQGLWVNPSTGEVPIHPGAVGSASFLFVTSHPHCPDTVPLSVEVRARQQSVMTVNGASSTTACQTGPDIVPDTASPQGGVFRSWTGLAVVDSVTGLFSPSQSAAGQHQLWYIPSEPCHDSVAVTVNVLPPLTATVSYPTIPVDSGLPTLCQGSPVAWPVITSGSAGGMFLCQPPGLAMSQGGGIDPSASIPGTYAVAYVPAGMCPEPAAALPYLVVRPSPSASFTLSQTAYCAWDSLRPQAANPSGTWEVVDAGGITVSSSAALPLPLSGILPGAYTLRHSTGGFCSDTATALFSVTATDDASFTYPSPSYCMGGGDPWPIVSGTGGGVFSPVTMYTVVDPDGRLRLQGSGAGSHTVRHRTQGQCPDSAEVAVIVFAQASAVFSYPSGQYCTADTNPVPLTVGTPGGVFSAGSGLAIVPSTGEVILPLSQPGAWDVTYTLSGSCQSSYTLTLEVGQTDTTTAFSYPPVPLCHGSAGPFPLIIGDTVGGFVTGAGAFLASPLTGQLDLSRTLPGFYTVHYDIANRCATDRSAEVWVNAPDDPAFSYPQGAYCEGGDNPLPSHIATAGGTFSEPTGNVRFADTVAGLIDASTSMAGAYIVTYTTAGPCPQTSTLPLAILPRPDDPGLVAEPATTVCEGQAVAVLASVSGADSLLWLVNGNRSSEDGPLLMLEGGAAGTDTVSLVLRTAQGCADTSLVTISRSPAPHLSATLTGRHTDASGTTVLRYAVTSDLDVTAADWTAQGAGAQAFQPASGTLTLPVAGVQGAVTLTARPETPHGLGSVTLLLMAEAGGCLGQPLVITDTIAPDARRVFVPEVITPDGNGLNDTWMLVCPGDADPDSYTMRLHNGAGAKVLEMAGLRQDFDGGTLPDGVYWWVLEDGQGRKVQSGGLTIRRK